MEACSPGDVQDIRAIYIIGLGIIDFVHFPWTLLILHFLIKSMGFHMLFQWRRGACVEIVGQGRTTFLTFNSKDMTCWARLHTNKIKVLKIEKFRPLKLFVPLLPCNLSKSIFDVWSLILFICGTTTTLFCSTWARLNSWTFSCDWSGNLWLFLYFLATLTLSCNPTQLRPSHNNN